MMKRIQRYELTTTQNEEGLYQIRALVDNRKYNVKAGDVGGWIEHESNLKQDGIGWISTDSSVRGQAVVRNALIQNNSRILGGSILREGVFDDSIIENSFFNKKGEVRGSVIRNSSFYAEHKIENSVIQNVSSAAKVEMLTSTFESKEKSLFSNGNVKIKQSLLVVEKANVSNPLHLLGVVGTIKTLKVEVKTVLSYVNFLSEMDELILSKSTIPIDTGHLNKEKVICLGDKENPILMDAKTIHLRGLKIVGNVKIEGDFIGIYSSYLRDCTELKMSGVAQLISLSEFAILEAKNIEEQRGIQNVSLTNDEHRVF